MYNTIEDLTADINHLAWEQEYKLQKALLKLEELDEAEKAAFAELRKVLEDCASTLDEIGRLGTHVQARGKDISTFLGSITEVVGI